MYVSPLFFFNNLDIDDGMDSDTPSCLFSLDQENISYQDTTILKNVTLEINQGEKVGLIGPSGAGKTTLLRTALPESFGAVEHLSISIMPWYHNCPCFIMFMSVALTGTLPLKI